jgi:hypothetical protein
MLRITPCCFFVFFLPLSFLIALAQKTLPLMAKDDGRGMKQRNNTLMIPRDFAGSFICIDLQNSL